MFYPQDRANQLFKQVHEQKSLKGRSNDAIASACLYIACRQEGVPRTFKGNNKSCTKNNTTCENILWPKFVLFYPCKIPDRHFKNGVPNYVASVHHLLLSCPSFHSASMFKTYNRRNSFFFNL